MEKVNQILSREGPFTKIYIQISILHEKPTYIPNYTHYVLRATLKSNDF